MNNKQVFGILLGGALALSALAVAAAPAPTAPAAPAAPQRPPGAPPAGGAPLEILDFKPAFDDLMTMLVQPRHTKLWLAGQQRNWQLAGFQLNELGAALRRVGATIPKYRNISVDATVTSMFAPKVGAVLSAINAQNINQFNAAYGELTAACNLCHEALDHAFLVVKVPDATAASAFPNQSFAPVAGAPAGK